MRLPLLTNVFLHNLIVWQKILHPHAQWWIWNYRGLRQEYVRGPLTAKVLNENLLFWKLLLCQRAEICSLTIFHISVQSYFCRSKILAPEFWTCVESGGGGGLVLNVQSFVNGPPRRVDCLASPPGKLVALFSKLSFLC